ncbi:toll/interleukin-1 receptor domain-containing protein [Frankia sp. Cas3]|uniref:toll/interleukin-1 receptor domain-containing protein n=1 Tax=Frankia sp. Cas3 TaxID=3073926 RepID=UPI002AD46547|nr:toll/interleukin-1 receptor domain-containing protein [Frankia sp. Cas3]
MGDGTGRPIQLRLSADERRDLLDTCAKIAGTEGATGMLLDRIGYPRGYRPGWQGTIPVHWWHQVFAELDNGIVVDPYHRLLEAALDLYPANPVLTTIAGRHDITHDDPLTAEIDKHRSQLITNRPSRAVEQSNPASERIILCYSKHDQERVRALYDRLRNDGLAPWLDDEGIPPGKERELLVRKAIRESAAVLVCLSANATNRRDFLHRAIRLALDTASEQPEGATYIIPVRLEVCDIPDLLRPWQPVDLFDGRGYEKLLRALRGLPRTRA